VIAQHRAALYFFTLLSLLLVSTGPSSLLQDADTFWHTVVGKRIIEDGRLLTTDEFTFPFYGERWIPSQWLAECAMAVVDRAFGLTGLALGTAFLLAATYAWGAARVHGSGLHWLATLLVAALVLGASSHHFHARPHIVTIAFSAVLAERLCAVERGALRIASLFWLVPLFILWTNLHGGVLGGIGSLGLVAGGWSVAYFAGLPSPVKCRHDVLLLGGLVAACIPTVFVNPYGIGIPQMWLEIMSADLPNLIIEHAPLKITRGSGLMTILFAVFFAVVLLGTRRIPKVTWVLPLVWFLLSLNRIRHGPIFAVIAFIVLAEILPESRVAHWLKRRGWFRFKPDEPEPRVAATASQRAAQAGLSVVLFLACYAVIWPVAYGTWTARPPRKIWPVELLPDLQRLAKEHGPGARIFNEQRLAGFLIYNVPEFRVFIDGRCELCGEEFLRKYVAAQGSPETLAAWDARYEFQSAIVGTQSPFNRYFAGSPGWKLVGKTDDVVLYARRTGS
jgi:hypothetical protein